MLTYFSRLTPYQRWRYAFWGMLIFRLMLPVYYGPMDHFYSDMVRHWNNGIDLFNPPLWGAIDSKLYQVYMAVLIRLGGQAEAPIHLYSGVLCAALPYVWYRAIRELYGKNTSLKLGLCIGLCPSFLVIYEYFMTETLLLVMLGLSVWQTLRAVRIKTRRAIVLAGVINALTCYTRLIALPVSLALTVYLWSVTPCKKALMRSALGVFGLLYVIFGLHSLKVIDRFSALGYPSINAFYHFSGAQSFEMILTNERYIFSSPSFHSNLWEPFGTFTSCRRKGSEKLFIDRDNISQNVTYQLRNLKAIFTKQMFWCHWRENQLFLLFGSSWPDSLGSIESPLHYLNLHSRWIWAPLIILLLAATPFIRTRPEEMLILLCAVGIFLCLSFQQTAVMEGRYRKPLEPLLIISCYIIFRRFGKAQADGVSAWRFVYSYYLQPIWEELRCMWRRVLRPSFRRRN